MEFNKEVPKVQYRDELISAATCVYEANSSKKMRILNQIQLHAVNQIKEGYTGFRISKLKRDDEQFLAEWAEMTNAKVKMIKFRCFENSKKYIIRQFIVDLRNSVDFGYSLEGKTLIIE